MGLVMKSLVLFDIDGTLLLTGGAGKAAFDQVFFELYGLREAWGEVHPDGRTDPSLISELFEKNLGRRPTSQEQRRVGEAYTRALSRTLAESPRFRVLPGVSTLIENLHRQERALLALATGNFEQTAWMKLKQAGLKEFFQCGGFGSDHPDRLALTRIALARGRQALGRMVEAEEVFLVGDTPADIRCGKLLGMCTVAVATGSTSRQTLAQYQPDFLLDSLGDFEEVLNIFA